MKIGPYYATAVTPSWADFARADGGENDGRPMVAFALKTREDAEDLGPFVLTLDHAIELRRVLNVAIDLAILERRTIEGEL